MEEQIKVWMSFFDGNNEKLTKRFPKNYDLVRIALDETMSDGISVARLVIRENT